MEVMLPRRKLIQIILVNTYQETCLPTLSKRQFSKEKELSVEPSWESKKEKQAYSLVRKKDDNFNYILKVFHSKEGSTMDLWRFDPKRFSKENLKNWLLRLNKTIELEQQKYIPERHQILGSDLAAAHFLVSRGGKVKFHDKTEWIERNEDGSYELPKKFEYNMYIHSVDASNINLRYESLVNFTNLTRLKWLSFKNCPNVDNWFLDRISGEYSETLEYLDISECPGITEHGLSCIYRLRHLRSLIVSNMKNTRSFEYMCLVLEDSMPNLSIEGVKYLEINEEEIN